MPPVEFFSCKDVKANEQCSTNCCVAQSTEQPEGCGQAEQPNISYS